MLTMAGLFLTGIADANFSYEVTRNLAYGFGFNTLTISELIGNLFDLLPF